MNGETTPAVSAGSNSVGASEKCTAHVICPSGAARATGGTVSANASAAPRIRARALTRSPASGVEDDLQRITGPLLERVDRLMDSAEGEPVRDERLRSEAARGEQRERASDAGASFPALGVDRDVPPDGAADVGGDRPVVEGDQQHLAARLCHADGLVEGLVAAGAVDDQICAFPLRGLEHRGDRIRRAAVDDDVGAELPADL